MVFNGGTIMTIHEKIIDWFAHGEIGLSSGHMATIAGGSTGNGFAPGDPDDLNRCIKLVDSVPEVREHFPAIAASSPRWNAVIEHWDELVSLFTEEAAGRRYFSAPKTWSRMKELGL
jgi:hypothetical protein